MNRLTPLILAAALVAGCMNSRPPAPDDPGSVNPGITPAQQCALLRTSVTAAETGLLLANIKDATAAAAVDSALQGVKDGADNYCQAVVTGETPDALGSFLVGFNSALADFNAKLRAARRLPPPSVTKLDPASAAGLPSALVALPRVGDRVALARVRGAACLAPRTSS